MYIFHKLSCCSILLELVYKYEVLTFDVYLFSSTKTSFFYSVFFWLFSQESPQQHVDQNDAAMDLISSVTGVDEEGRSRQRILTYAARRYCHS